MYHLSFIKNLICYRTILLLQPYYKINTIVFILNIIFTFNNLADAFIQSDVQMRRIIEAIRPSMFMF